MVTGKAIKVDGNIIKLLDKSKIIPDETYNSVLVRLLKGGLNHGNTKRVGHKTN